MLHQVSESHCNLDIKSEYMWECKNTNFRRVGYLWLRVKGKKQRLSIVLQLLWNLEVYILGLVVGILVFISLPIFLNVLKVSQ